MLLQTTTIRAEYESTTHSSFGATSVTYIRECASGAALGEHCRLRRLRRHLAQEPQQLDQPTPLEHVHACRYHRLLRRGHPTSSKTTAIASSDTLVRTSLEGDRVAVAGSPKTTDPTPATKTASSLTTRLRVLLHQLGCGNVHGVLGRRGLRRRWRIRCQTSRWRHNDHHHHHRYERLTTSTSTSTSNTRANCFRAATRRAHRAVRDVHDHHYAA